MFKKVFFVLLLAALLLTACAVTGLDPMPAPTSAPSSAPELMKIRLPMGYIPNVQYAPFYVAVERGYFRDAGIELEFDYSFETDGVALVGSAQLPFAIVSGEQVLLARSQGLPVVYIAAWYQEYPISVVAKTASGISKPEDLKGRKVGLPGPFGANYVGFRAMLSKLGIKETDLTLDSIGFTQVEALATDKDDAVIGYTANEPVVLRAQGYDVVEWRVADYVKLASNGILTNEKTLAENPELAQKFVAAFLKGLNETIADPDAAYEISKKYVENLAEADAAVQKKVLSVSIEMWRAERPGYSAPESWEAMQTVLLEMGMYDTALDLSKVFSNQFIP